jgi:hypothetical protein
MDTDTEKRGFAWQAKLALRFQIPLQASLRGIRKTHRSPAALVATLGRELRPKIEDRS